MRFKPASFYKLSTTATTLLWLSACAPQQPPPKAKEIPENITTTTSRENNSDDDPQDNSTVDETSVDAQKSRPASIPINEDITGRVTQVEEYILQNAAIPDSLKVKAWGEVQPHEKGYKVRVQYSLNSAEGFGLSNEDMMFFMNSRGRVYQKAPVK